MAKRNGQRRVRRKKALLVGINQYPSQPLKGCVNDALMIGNLLIDHFGFKPGEDMRLVVDDRATKDAILNRLDWLVDGAKAGDILVFHFSGHGSQVPEREPGSEVDAVDECIIPIDHDWDSPLIDDDLAQFVKAVPDEVNLTVILDNCNSGTGTRIFAPGSVPPTVKRLLPPPDIQFRAVADISVTPGLNYYSVTMTEFRSLELQRFGHTVTEKGILVAGCRSNQLAKDAFIEGDFHGALTYSLHQALKENGPDQSYAAWIDVATRILKERHQIPEQDPQLECPAELAEWKLFSTDKAHPAPGRAARAAAARHVVFVHGICAHSKGFSDPWWESMREFVPSIQLGNQHEVLWSDLVTSAGRAFAVPLPNQADVAQNIKDVLIDRRQQQLVEEMVEGDGAERSYENIGSRAFLGIPGLDCVDDFTKYLLSDTVRSQVIARFQEVVAPLLRNGVEVQVVSHSWGTVVAYEALCLMEADGTLPAGSVRNFFTVGSALSIAPVKRLLLPAAIAGKKPRVIHRWINVDARFDLVGGPLKGLPFEVDFEHLRLKPIGCSRFASPACAHSSYFVPDNIAVNRDIFGKYVEDVGVRLGFQRTFKETINVS